MSYHQLFSDYSTLTLIAIIAMSFIAGFIDAVVGGGGLIQIPGLLILFPKSPFPALIGTNKIAGLAGTSVAAYNYSKKVKFNYLLLGTIALFSFAASYFGAKTVSFIPAGKLKPLILMILISIFIFTIFKKDLGRSHKAQKTFRSQLLCGGLIGAIVGFYDGFFGPGAGSFFVFGFVLFLGFEFIQASADAKFINCITNISALIVFIMQKNFIMEIAILMAFCNVLGNIIGTKMAFSNGNEFIRIVFILVVGIMIARYGYDIFVA